jgi:hypothetical protein
VLGQCRSAGRAREAFALTAPPTSDCSDAAGAREGLRTSPSQEVESHRAYENAASSATDGKTDGKTDGTTNGTTDGKTDEKTDLLR